MAGSWGTLSAPSFESGRLGASISIQVALCVFFRIICLILGAGGLKFSTPKLPEVVTLQSVGIFS